MSGRRGRSRTAWAALNLSTFMVENFDQFVDASFGELYDGAALRDANCVEVLCRAVQDVIDGDQRRLLITMPPRHLKSFVVSVCLPALMLGIDPRLKIGVATYGEELAREHADLCQRLMTSDAYRAIFPQTRLSLRLRWRNLSTDCGGGRRSVTVGGPFTGLGVDMLIVDDVLKASDVHSPAMRLEAERFLFQTASTRFDDPTQGRIIVAMQRLHPEDIVAQLKASGLYDNHLNMPAIIPETTDYRSYSQPIRFEAGAPLAPDRFPLTELEALRRTMGHEAFSAQFLQAPVLSGGAQVAWSSLHFYGADDPKPETTMTVVSVDPAISQADTADYTAMTVWDFDGEQWRLVDLLRARLSFPEIRGQLRELARRHSAEIALIEDGHIGRAIWQEMQGEHLRLRVWPVAGTKAERLAVALSPLYDATFLLPRDAPWLEHIRYELTGFPHARHDDIVDSITQLTSWLRSRRPYRELESLHGCRPGELEPLRRRSVPW